METTMNYLPVEDREGTVSLVCSCVWLGGGLVASPCWDASVSTAADSGVSTSSFYFLTKTSYFSYFLACEAKICSKIENGIIVVCVL